MISATWLKLAIEWSIYSYWSDRIAFTWAVEDAMRAAKRHDNLLEQDQAKNTLQAVSARYDPEVGITWDIFWIFMQDKIREHPCADPRAALDERLNG